MLSFWLGKMPKGITNVSRPMMQMETWLILG